jgi:hypothetical protein
MIGVLLLMQWLTSAYACPQVEQPASRGLGGAATVPVAMADCHGMTAASMDPANPALCKAHCDADKQAPVAKAQGDVPNPALAWFIVASATPHDVLPPSVEVDGVIVVGRPPGWPPLYLLHRVLRN